MDSSLTFLKEVLAQWRGYEWGHGPGMMGWGYGMGWFGASTDVSPRQAYPGNNPYHKARPEGSRSINGYRSGLQNGGGPS